MSYYNVLFALRVLFAVCASLNENVPRTTLRDHSYNVLNNLAKYKRYW